MSQESNVPWVVMSEKNGGIGECLRCGQTLPRLPPLPVEVFVAALRAFVQIHVNCAAAPEEGKAQA